MKLLVVLAFSAIAAFAQTAVALDQMKKAPGDVSRVVVILADGIFRQVEIGPGLAIVDGKLVASIPPGPPVTVPFTKRLAESNGKYILPPGTESVTVNGLVMEEGEDFTVSGNVLTPRFAWPDSPMVVARGREVSNPIVLSKPVK